MSDTLIQSQTATVELSEQDLEAVAGGCCYEYESKERKHGSKHGCKEYYDYDDYYCEKPEKKHHHGHCGSSYPVE